MTAYENSTKSASGVIHKDIGNYYYFKLNLLNVVIF